MDADADADTDAVVAAGAAAYADCVDVVGLEHSRGGAGRAGPAGVPAWMGVVLGYGKFGGWEWEQRREWRGPLERRWTLREGVAMRIDGGGRGGSVSLP